jgi:hypothetical protein
VRQPMAPCEIILDVGRDSYRDQAWKTLGLEDTDRQGAYRPWTEASLFALWKGRQTGKTDGHGLWRDNRLDEIGG